MSPADKNMFSAMEKDAIGEIMNISIGSSATAISNMLQQRTDITTPRVEVVSPDEFEITSMEPAVGVEIEYVQGIEGKNIFVLKKTDIKKIVETLLMTEIPDDEFELNELNMSAVCEVMNQMMGAASTALATLLGEPVNISPPLAYEVDSVEDIKSRYFTNDENVVVVRFNFKIENILDSEFLSVMPMPLARRVVSMFATLESDMEENYANIAASDQSEPLASQPEEVPAAPQPQEPVQQPVQPQYTEAPPMQQQPMQPQYAEAPPMQQQPMQPQYAEAPPMQQQPMQPQYAEAPPMQQQPMQPQYREAPPVQYAQQPMQQPAGNYYQSPPPQYAPQQPKMYQVQDPYSQQFDYGAMNLAEGEGKNLDMLMTVPLEISVEIGRARKPIKDIIAFTQGTLVVLDKLAGEQVDLYVNNQCIAKGDVVVVDDSFGVRITKILDKNEILQNR